VEAPHRVRAAVLVPLYQQAHGLELIFTRRTEDVLTHKGQISFPGGSREAGDTSLQVTALREAQEELGIRPESVDILGELDDVLTASSHFLVTPFVGLYRGALSELRPEPREVAEVISIPVASLRNPGNLHVERRQLEGAPATAYFYRHGSHVIWGATARILHDFLALF